MKNYLKYTKRFLLLAIAIMGVNLTISSQFTNINSQLCNDKDIPITPLVISEDV